MLKSCLFLLVLFKEDVTGYASMGTRGKKKFEMEMLGDFE